MIVTFDTSLQVLADAISEHLGQSVLAEGVALRDSSGGLSFVSSALAPQEAERLRLIKLISEKLGPYGRDDDVLIFADDPGATQLLADTNRLPFHVNQGVCWVIDRRIVGSGWLTEPSTDVWQPPRIVFASLKGGVGRSTAISVSAHDLAARGQNVLVIDLDVEAPGLGSLMLPQDRLPVFGVVDYLVNSTGRTFKEDELDAFVSLSPLTQGDTGRIDVLPAFGSASARQPENILPKIARAMTEQVDGEGEVVAMGPRLSSMIARFTARGSYDVVLIDSRAGLAELAAPAVLSLGALVLLFGTAQNQTITGFGALFAGLKLLATRSILMGGDADWRLMFKPVYAKASLDPVTAERYRADIYDLFAENLYDQVEDLSTEGDSFNFSIDDLDAPHEPLIIPFDSRFVDFDPAVTQSQLTRSFYEQTFRPFLDGLDKALDWMSEIANAPSDT